MVHRSDPEFLVLHGLRVKGFAKPAAVAELVALPEVEVSTRLEVLAGDGLARYRDGRLAAWALTAEGRDAHRRHLAQDLGAAGTVPALRATYPHFSRLDARLKALCGDWQLRPGPDGEPAANDHADAAYDRGVVERLLALDADARSLCQQLGAALARFEPYGGRLQASAAAVAAGDRARFTGVLCGSYHDVWMELHEDLIVTLGIDRRREGSV